MCYLSCQEWWCVLSSYFYAMFHTGTDWPPTEHLRTKSSQNVSGTQGGGSMRDDDSVFGGGASRSDTFDEESNNQNRLFISILVCHSVDTLQHHNKQFYRQQHCRRLKIRQHRNCQSTLGVTCFQQLIYYEY
jgi:hypothetical protein